MKMTEPLRAVIAELDRAGVPWRVEYGGKHPIVRFLNHTQVISGSKSGGRALQNARAHTRRVLREAKVT